MSPIIYKNRQIKHYFGYLTMTIIIKLFRHLSHSLGQNLEKSQPGNCTRGSNLNPLHEKQQHYQLHSGSFYTYQYIISYVTSSQGLLQH